jgi:succinate-semialdehyde dehydrogenase/glutarate-semialdehyde dehydrogenase
MSIYESIESNDSRRHLQLRSPVTLEPTGELICANLRQRGGRRCSY